MSSKKHYEMTFKRMTREGASYGFMLTKYSEDDRIFRDNLSGTDQSSSKIIDFGQTLVDFLNPPMELTIKLDVEKK